MNDDERLTAAAEAADAGHPTDAPDEVPSSGPARVRRRTLWLTVTASVLLGVIAGTAVSLGWQVFALVSVAEAGHTIDAASEALDDVTDRRGIAIDRARAALDSMTEFDARQDTHYLSEGAAKELAAAQAGLEKVSAGLSYTPFEAPGVADIGDLMPWTVIGELQARKKLVQQERAAERAHARDVVALDAAQDAFSASVATAYAELAAHGEQVLAESGSATYASTYDLRDAIDSGKSERTGSQFGGTGLLRIVAAIDGVNAAQQAGEAAKQDPAYPVRAQIMEYARSISFGVRLDFEWHQLVSDLGDDWYSGTAQNTFEGDGWSVIDLNFGVQNGWRRGDVDARALVVHEVGHAQMLRPQCKALFEQPVFEGNQETWATAWAISMGFDTLGSGISAYGRPSDEQIAVAGQCR